jgi:hypothetical protein
MSDTALPLELAPVDADSYDPDEGENQDDEANTLIYPADLPPCDEEDGTATSAGSPVDACIWDTALHPGGKTFIVIRP